MQPDSTEYAGGSTFKVIGTRPVRHDGVDKVTGRAVYGADVRLPDMPMTPDRIVAALQQAAGRAEEIPGQT